MINLQIFNAMSIGFFIKLFFLFLFIIFITGRIERFLYNRGSKEVYVYNSISDNTNINKKEEYIYLESLRTFLSEDYINQLVETIFKNIPLKL